MEVHHHPDLHHEKKKFKEYFLECIMIFIAVTLGFFAETIRDGISERHRERDYIVGLINNLRDDTSNLTGLIARNDLEVRGIDYKHFGSGFDILLCTSILFWIAYFSV